MKKYLLYLILSVPFLFGGCTKNGGLNIFSIQDDIKLGQQTKAQIESNPAQFPILKRSAHAKAYSYIEKMRDEILASGKLQYSADFPWEVYIIKDDAIQNAFCTPGGYIYVYTGLIKYLDNKSSLAGVLGHEMAHADQRHSTNQITKQYGIQALLDIVLGKNQGLLTEVAASLVSLKFSRSDEKDADNHSVIYLCPTKYHADGAAAFFQKIIDEGHGSSIDFLSTHPSPDNRVENIKAKATSLSCTSTISNTEENSEYISFKNSL